MSEPIMVGERPAGNRRVVRLAAAAAALIVAVVVLPPLLFGSGGGSNANDQGILPPNPNASASTPTTEAPAPETFQAFTSKNPFTPLAETGAAAPATDGGSTPAVTDTTLPPDQSFPFPSSGDTGSSSGDTGSSSGDTGSGSSGGSSTPTTQPGPPPPPARQPDRVSLLQVFPDANGRLTASVRVNDTTYRAGEGDTFATSYKVLQLDGSTRCGQFLFGDERFGLCEGDEVQK